MLNVYGIDSITIVRAGIIGGKSTDINNEPNPTTDEDLDAYVEWETKKIIDINGEEVLSSGRVIMPYDSILDHRDKFKINDVEYPIIKIVTGKDFAPVKTVAYLK